MKIKHLTVKNFKSFSELSIDFRNFNVLIGSNAAGKSNFIDVIRFLRHIEESGIDNAISLLGGKKHFLNLSIRQSKPFYVKIVMEDEQDSWRVIKDRFLGIKEIGYEFEITFNKSGETDFKLTKDRLIFHYQVGEFEEKTGGLRNSEILGEATLSIENKEGFASIQVEDTIKAGFKAEHFLPTFFLSEKLPKNIPLINSHFMSLMSATHSGLFKGIGIFDFEPKSIKTSSPIIGKVVLEEDASNLPVVLKNLLTERKTKRELVDLISDVLPFVLDMKVAETGDKSLRLELKEDYGTNPFLPSNLVSDGTAQAIALIVALYFGRRSISIFEEPERNLHPSLICKMVEHIKNVSENQQVIVTTQDVNILKNLEVEEVLFINRAESGFSLIERLSDRTDITHFLENEIGIDELYSSNLLSVH
jgi:predicted ATPase